MTLVAFCPCSEHGSARAGDCVLTLVSAQTISHHLAFSFGNRVKGLSGNTGMLSVFHS